MSSADWDPAPPSRRQVEFDEAYFDQAAEQILAKPSKRAIKATAAAVDHDPPYIGEPGDLPDDLAGAFALGVEAGAADLAKCCGCSGTADGITNPYDGSTL